MVYFRYKKRNANLLQTVCFVRISNTGIVRSFSCSLRSRRFRVPRRRFSCHEALPRRKAQRLNRMWRCKASSHNTIKARRAAKPTGKAECFVVARQRLRNALAQTLARPSGSALPNLPSATLRCIPAPRLRVIQR